MQQIPDILIKESFKNLLRLYYLETQCNKSFFFKLSMIIKNRVKWSALWNANKLLNNFFVFFSKLLFFYQKTSSVDRVHTKMCRGDAVNSTGQQQLTLDCLLKSHCSLFFPTKVILYSFALNMNWPLKFVYFSGKISCP